MATATHPTISLDQYLELERAAEQKSEFYDGHIVAMSGGSLQHARIPGNILAKLHAGLLTHGCAIFTSDLKVKSGNNLFYPDLTICCGTPVLLDQKSDVLLNPLIVIEVLSPSTEVRDRGYKFRQYAKIESLREIVFVSQTEPLVEVFTRKDETHRWEIAQYEGLEASSSFGSIPEILPLSDIYAGIPFPIPVNWIDGNGDATDLIA